MQFKSRQSSVADAGDNMLPMMSLMLILIPFLVGNIVFLKYDAYTASIPGASNDDAPPMEAPTAKEMKVMAQLKVEADRVELSLVNETSGEGLEKVNFVKSKLKDLSGSLVGFRKKYPKWDAVLISFQNEVRYEFMAELMSEVSQSANLEIAGSKKVNVVVLPREKQE